MQVGTWVEVAPGRREYAVAGQVIPKTVKSAGVIYQVSVVGATLPEFRGQFTDGFPVYATDHVVVLTPEAAVLLRLGVYKFTLDRGEHAGV